MRLFTYNGNSHKFQCGKETCKEEQSGGQSVLVTKLKNVNNVHDMLLKHS